MSNVVDYENVAPHLLVRLSSCLEIRTDRCVYDIVHLREIPEAVRDEYTHKAVSLGRFGTLDALSKALLTKAMLHHEPESPELADIQSFLKAVTQIDQAIVAHFKTLTSLDQLVDAAVKQVPRVTA